jgi:hypothetical protein
MTVDLYNTADVKKVREILIQEQDGLCAITGIPTASNNFALDHKHDEEQLVRGAAHKQANAALGKLENLAVRYLYWYPEGLPEFLRACAAYIEKKPDRRWRHPGWLKKANTLFNKLKESDKDKVLSALGQPTCKNGVERKKLFQKALLTREFKYDTIRQIIEGVKSC